MSSCNGNYNPEEFIVPAKNIRGESAKARFRISLEDRDIIEAIVSSRRFPYRFPSDFYRHAVIVLFESLSSYEDLDNLVAKYHMKLAATQKESTLVHKVAFDILEQKIEQHLSSGRVGDARRVLQRFIGCLQNQPRSCGRDRCLARVRERWGSLLASVYYPACLKREFRSRTED